MFWQLGCQRGSVGAPAATLSLCKYVRASLGFTPRSGRYTGAWTKPPELVSCLSAIRSFLTSSLLPSVNGRAYVIGTSRETYPDTRYILLFVVDRDLSRIPDLSNNSLSNRSQPSFSTVFIDALYHKPY